MNRSELTGEEAIDIVLRELKYQSTIHNANQFVYDPRNTKIVQDQLTKDEQLTILRTLRDQKRIGLVIESATSDLSGIIGTEPHTITLFLVDVTLTKFPSSQSNTQPSEYVVGVDFSPDSGVLYLLVNGNKEQVAKLSHGGKAFLILEKLFTSKPGAEHKNTDIFGEGSAKTNLTQILMSNRLKWLLMFMNEDILPRKASLAQNIAKLSANELVNLITQINAKYQLQLRKHL